MPLGGGATAALLPAHARAGTYGKTWHTWQVDRGDPLPYGRP